jgi:hypothetical protein
MEPDPARRSAVDEPARWGNICEHFGQLRDDAVQYGMERRWRSLVDATRRGTAAIEDWVEFEAELAMLHDAEEDFSWRHGEPVTALRIEPVATGYGCPGGICRRTAAPFPAGDVPRCALLDKKMVEVGHQA